MIKWIFNELITISMYVADAAIVIGLMIATFSDIHSGAVVCSIGVLIYIVNTVWKERRFLFKEES